MDVADARPVRETLTRSAHGCLDQRPLARCTCRGRDSHRLPLRMGGLALGGQLFRLASGRLKAMTEFLASSGIHAHPEPSADRTLVVRDFMEAAACGSGGEVTLVHSYVAQWGGRGKKKPTRPIELVEIDKLCCG